MRCGRATACWGVLSRGRTRWWGRRRWAENWSGVNVATGDQDQDQDQPGRRRDNLKTVECDNDCLGMIVIAPSCSCLPERGVGVSHASVVGQAALARSVMSTHEQAGLSARLPPDHTGLHAQSQDC